MNTFTDFGEEPSSLDTQQVNPHISLDTIKYSLTQAAKELGVTRSGMHWLLVNRSLIGECETIKRTNGKNLFILIPAKTLEKLRNIRKD